MLADANTFELLDKDPTTTYKRKLISILSDLKKSGKLEEHQYRIPLGFTVLSKYINPTILRDPW